MRWIIRILAVLTLLLASRTAWTQSIPSPPSGKPSAADEAAAKKNFESGLKLYGEGSYAEALIAFEQSYRVGGRPSALKNIAQCHRSLKHFVEAYEALEQMVTLHETQVSAADKKAAQQTMDELAVLTGTIEVTVAEADAEISIDGKSIAKSPMQKPKRVSVGSHTVRVTKTTFAPAEQQLNVGSQEAKKIEIKLEPEKTTGHVLVREQSGRDVHVFVDAEDKGPAPWEGDVAAGSHAFEAKSARFASDVRKLTVSAKDRLDLVLDALPLTGHLRVTTVPATANITVDGKPVGTGAWEGDLPEGAHRIEVGYEGQSPQVREITIARGQLVVQEIPVVGAIASGRLTEYPGIYVRFALAGMIGTGVPDDSGAPSFRNDSSVDLGGLAALRVGNAFDWWGLEGVAAFMLEHRERHYHFNDTGTGNPPTSFDYGITPESTGPNVFLGAGGRATTKGDTIRFTFGLSPGIAIRWFSPRLKDSGCDNGGCNSSPPNNNNNNPGGGSNHFVQSEQNQFAEPTGSTNNPGQVRDISFPGSGYTAFALMLDAGIMIGSTPGTKFVIGAQAWIDFPPDTLVMGPDTVFPMPNRNYKQPGRGYTLVDGPQFYIGPTIGLQFGH
jgi:hypothetical protein